MMKNVFVRTLSEEIQNEIKIELNQLGLDKEDIENALDSRLLDLADTININKYK
jgi:SOS response regulatory protein OraA/RecX